MVCAVRTPWVGAVKLSLFAAWAVCKEAVMGNEHPEPFPRPVPEPIIPPPVAYCPCGVCPPDSSQVCSYTGTDKAVYTAYVANAYRGNLILCPGSGEGAIGGLLHSLTPPQHYSHMGIFVADQFLIRHCTESEDRLTAPEYYTSAISFGAFGQVPVPLEGFMPQHLEYGWPGAVTQTVEQALIAARGTPTAPGQTEPYNGADLIDWESQQNPKSRWQINGLSFDPVSDDGETWYPALIVKPCPDLQTPAVTEALVLVAAEALSMFAHYRFGAFTDGTIGDDPNLISPPVQLPAAMPSWDPVNNKWADWSGDVNWVTVPTIAAVCSSFVWQAIQNINKHSPVGKIILDWAASQSDALGASASSCVRAVPPDWAGDSTDPDTRDGLFFYPEAERITAAKWLHDDIANIAFQQAAAKLGAIGDLIDDIGTGTFLAAAATSLAAVESLLGNFWAGAVIGAPLTAAIVADLVELLYTMPGRLGNQMCNAFAFNCINGGPADTHCVDAEGNVISSATESSNWSGAPGVGRAVSPDDIHMFWDAPGPSIPGSLQGLYGYNEPVQVVLAWTYQPICELVPSTGAGTIVGFVTLNGTGVKGAVVQAGCANPVITQGPDIEFRLPVQAGAKYKVVARYTNPQTKVIMYGEGPTGVIQPNQTTPPLEIKLIPPPACNRNIVVSGWLRADDVGFFGTSHADNYFSTTLYVQSGIAQYQVLQSGSAGWTVNPAYQVLTDANSESVNTGDSNGNLSIAVTLNPADLSVDVTLIGALNGAAPAAAQPPANHNVQADTVWNVPEFSLDDGGTFPDRAYFRNLQIRNIAGSAI
jgi:hypothetical protein